LQKRNRVGTYRHISAVASTYLKRSYIHKGKVVVGPRYGPKHETDKDLVFTKSAHRDATAHWVEESKKENIHTWKKVAKRAFLDGIKK